MRVLSLWLVIIMGQVFLVSVAISRLNEQAPEVFIQEPPPRYTFEDEESEGYLAGVRSTFGDSCWPRPDNRPLRPLHDSIKVHRLHGALQDLDAERLPMVGDKAYPWIIHCFPDSFFFDEEGELRWQDNGWCWEATLERLNLDGRPPSDYAVKFNDGGSNGAYTIKTVVRSGHRIVYQTFFGSERGRLNTLWWRQGWTVPATLAEVRRSWSGDIGDVDGDGIPELILHENCEEFPDREGDLSMMDLSDLMLPIFWSGDRLWLDPDRAGSAYRNLTRSLRAWPPKDAWVMQSFIDSVNAVPTCK